MFKEVSGETLVVHWFGTDLKAIFARMSHAVWRLEPPCHCLEPRFQIALSRRSQAKRSFSHLWNRLRSHLCEDVPRELAFWNRHPIVWNQVPNHTFTDVSSETSLFFQLRGTDFYCRAPFLRGGPKPFLGFGTAISLFGTKFQIICSRKSPAKRSFSNRVEPTSIAWNRF